MALLLERAFPRRQVQFSRERQINHAQTRMLTGNVADPLTQLWQADLLGERLHH